MSGYHSDIRVGSQLSFLLYSAAKAFTRIYGNRLSHLNLTYPQVLAMMTLWESSPRTIGEISDALDFQNGALSPIIKRLTAKGLVTKSRDPNDQRSVVVAITKEGIALRDPVIAMRKKLLEDLGFNEDDLNHLRLMLLRFSEGLEKADYDPPDPVSNDDC